METMVLSRHAGQVHSLHRVDRQHLHKVATSIIDSNNRVDRCTTERSSKHNRRWRETRATGKYLLINITTNSAATVRRQSQHSNGFEFYWQLCCRFAIPFGTRSIGYLTKLLKPTFDTNNFEEFFATWELELSRFERDNGQQSNLQFYSMRQRHLQLLSGPNPNYRQMKHTIIEYHCSTMHSQDWHNLQVSKPTLEGDRH